MTGRAYLTLAAALAAGPALGQDIHRDGFAGREPAWRRGPNTVRGQELLHRITDQAAHNGPTCEHFRVATPVAHADPAHMLYVYPTPPAPVSDALSGGVWVKANRSGVTLMARVALPRSRHPDRPAEHLTAYMPLGDSGKYTHTGRWQQLQLRQAPERLKELRQTLRLKYRRDIDTAGAYIDQLALNLYRGPGTVDVFADDLTIGPVRDAGRRRAPDRHPRRNNGGLPVRLSGNRLTVDGKLAFVRAVRHSGGTPLHVLRDAGFNAVWFGPEASEAAIEEAVRHGLWIIPSLPLLRPERAEPDDPYSVTARSTHDPRTPEGLVASIKRFSAGDGVLFWDFGTGRSRRDLRAVARTAEAVRLADPGRPRAIDTWDGLQDFPMHVDLVGTHRWPLFSSLELSNYREWLEQRAHLTPGDAYRWTWVQTHVPPAHARLVYGDTLAKGTDQPVGPSPGQIRLMTYLAMASGCRALGFWSDKFLADSHHGRGRLLAMALLNAEIEMLKPALLGCGDRPTWVATSHPSVKAAVMRGGGAMGSVVVLPVWVGSPQDAGHQCVPGQCAARDLTITVPQVPSGAQPWEVLPGHVRSLQGKARRVLGGTQIVIPEFDMTAAVVFTNDLGPDGPVVWWQSHARARARQVAQWAIDLAAEEYRKTEHVLRRLQAMSAAGQVPAVPESEPLMARARDYLAQARRRHTDRDDRSAYLLGRRALRPLRVVMRAHWERAVKHLDTPTASPHAASFYTLPDHWRTATQLRTLAPGPSVLPGGGFEGPAPRALPDPKLPPGWRVAADSQDDARWQAVRVDAKPMRLPPTPPRLVPAGPFAPTLRQRRPRLDTAGPPGPELGGHCLRLTVTTAKDEKGQPSPAPKALEQTYLAVLSPEVSLPPGSLVRVSGWMHLLKPVRGSSDGVLLFDSAGGEALGVRLTVPTLWRQFRLYRRVPPNGKLSLTVMLTGVGQVWIDNLKIEPLEGAGRVSRR